MYKFTLNHLSAKKSKVKVTLCQRAPRLPGPYHFSISITGGFTLGRVFMLYIYNMWHLKYL